MRRVPVAVGSHRLVGAPAEVRGDGLVFVDGELWHARSADGSPLAPGERVVVEAVDQEASAHRRIPRARSDTSPPKGRDP